MYLLACLYSYAKSCLISKLARMASHQHLLAKGIIELKVSDQKNVSTINLNGTHIIVGLANACNSGGILMQAFCMEQS